jgi:serine/threonine-protein kinase
MGSIRPIRIRAADTGQLIAGKYRVERVIGEGGMGTVVCARHEILDVRVAIKVLSAEYTKEAAITARFLREARAVARLKSEHVAHVMDVGTTEQGQPFIVMELLDGENLEERLRLGPLRTIVAVDLFLQALEALAHAHALGIVHRDLKPANLFVATLPGGRRVVKVLDFGIAKLIDSVAGTEAVRAGGVTTGEHVALGSPSYMAPEQVQGLDIDPRADIWALGAILYELLTAKTAFAGKTVGEIFAAILHTDPPPLRSIVPDAPAGLEAVIQRCLERPPESRYADVAELARAVAPFGSGAWSGHVSRIEQVVTSAAVLFDADMTMTTRFRRWEAHGLVTSAEARATDTLPAPPSAPPRMTTRSRRQLFVAVLILGAMVGSISIQYRPRRALGVPRPATAASSVIGPIPPVAAATTVVSLPSSVAAPAPPTAATTSPRASPPARSRPKEVASSLPGVLRSPD